MVLFPLSSFRMKGGDIMRKTEKYPCRIILLLIIVIIIILIKIVPTVKVGTKPKQIGNST